MNRKSLFVPVALAAAAASPPAYAASEIDSCPAERYEPCSSFTASVALGEHQQIIDNHVAGFTRSKGSWTISVRYQPETQCAKVKIFVDMGPIDSLGEYKQDLRNGVGEIQRYRHLHAQDRQCRECSADPQQLMSHPLSGGLEAGHRRRRRRDAR